MRAPASARLTLSTSTSTESTPTHSSSTPSTSTTSLRSPSGSPSLPWTVPKSRSTSSSRLSSTSLRTTRPSRSSRGTPTSWPPTDTSSRAAPCLSTATPLPTHPKRPRPREKASLRFLSEYILRTRTHFLLYRLEHHILDDQETDMYRPSNCDTFDSPVHT